MKLSALHIENLRSFAKEDFALHNYTCIVGPNNSGKSTVLRAIQILLNQEKPEPDEWNASLSDREIVIGGCFSDLTEEERKIPGIAGLVFDGKIQLRARFAKDSEGKVTDSWEAYVQDESINGWKETFKELSPEIQEIAKRISLSAADFRNKGGKERLREAVRTERADLITKGDAGWTDEGVSIPEAFKQGLPRVYIVPAVRDARDEARQTQRKNFFAEILKTDVLPELKSAKEYEEIRTSAKALRDNLPNFSKVGAATKGISDQAGEVIPLGVALTFDIPELDELIAATARFTISDGQCSTSVGLQGHGAQRSLIYALYVHHAGRTPAKISASTRPIVFLFEEPELYIHPQLLRKLKESLVKLSQRAGWQVVVTSHSPIMVDVAERPQSLVILRRDTAGAVCKRQLEHDPFEKDGKSDERKILRALLDFHPTVCEAFFSDDTVLVEGDSEVAILRLASEVFAARSIVNRDILSTTIVSCDGKWTILPIARLLKELGIRFRVIHDTDEDQKAVDGRPAPPTKANAEILSVAGSSNVFPVSNTLEDILHLQPGTRYSSDKPFRARQRVAAIIEDKSILRHQRLLELFDFAFPGSVTSSEPAGKG